MPCVVPTCGASVGTFKLFPRHITLVERWLEAILVGCGVKADEGDGDLSRMEVCHWHFAKPDAEPYQEPKIFFNCKAEKVEIDSCRLCLRFHPICDMVTKDGMLSGKDIKFTVYESLGIDFQPNDLLELICIDCLARLELLKSIREDFMDAANHFHNLISIVQNSAKQVREPVKLPSPVEVIKWEDLDISNSKLDGDLVEEEDSSDEWTPPKALVEPSAAVAKRKSSSAPRIGSKQPRLTLRAITLRKCNICQAVLDSANDLAAHLIEKHANKGAIRCEECSRDFLTLAKYNKHLAHHDPTERPHKCSFCPMHYKIKNNKMMHENTAHGTNHAVKPQEEKVKPTICETCGESFMLRSLLRYHVKQKHPASKPTCKICEKTFTIHASLERHMLLHTDNRKPYVCSHCEVRFRRLFDLKNHVQKVHEGRNPHTCVECNKEFQSYETLYNHRRFVHMKKARNARPQHLNNGGPPQCELCKEIFPKTSDLEQHISISHTDASYPYLECSQCPRKFVINRQLWYHVRTTHNAVSKLVCVECGKQYRTSQDLKIHRESVHEKRRFDCSICHQKTYTTQAALRKHERTHTEGKRFSCDFCDKSFHRNHQLTIHRRTHTGEKPFECPKCLKRFGDDGTFCKHKKRCLASTAAKKEG